MTYRWIVLGVGTAVLGGAAWYFGRPVLPKVNPVIKVAEVSPAAEAPKDAPPPRVIDVIDLARAYDPVRDEDNSPQVAGTILLAGYIADPSAPTSIPYAAETDTNPFADVIPTVRETATGSFLPGVASFESIALPAKEWITIPPREFGLERITVTPREVRAVAPIEEEKERGSGNSEDDFGGIAKPWRGELRRAQYPSSERHQVAKSQTVNPAPYGGGGGLSSQPDTFVVRTVTTSPRTWAKPPSICQRLISVPLFRRNSPLPSRPMSAARPGWTPSSPSIMGSTTMSAGSSRTAFSGVTTTHWSCLPLAIGPSWGDLRSRR